MLRVLDLFSGIGGFSLGLERTGGFETVAFCEIEEFPRRVLAKHWPRVPCYDDVRTLTADRLRADGISVDVITGGFPCQDISVAGKGAGIEGERSGLWSEYARLVGELRPRFVIVENVAALLGRGLGRVLGDLAALGYDAEWHCIPASAVGAPHIRDRLWILAHPQHPDANRVGPYRAPLHEHGSAEPRNEQERVARPVREVLADAARDVRSERAARGSERQRVGSGGQSIALADAIGPGLEGRPRFAGHLAAELATAQRGGEVLDADGHDEAPIGGVRRGEMPEPGGSRNRGWWLAEPDVGRVAHGVPARVDRLRALGNAVVPQIPEIIGRAILNSINAGSSARTAAGNHSVGNALNESCQGPPASKVLRLPLHAPNMQAELPRGYVPEVQVDDR